MHSHDRHLTAFRRLLDDPRVVAFRELARGVPVHIVGGTLRDQLLDRPSPDLDLVVARDGERFASAVAERLGLRSIRVGGERYEAWRLVGKAGATGWIDIWDRDGATLADDLWRRDLTIHALALDINTGEVVDPTGGIADLEARVLRQTTPTAFAEDPVRSLRLARFALGFERFTTEARTLLAARQAAPRLQIAPFERVRTELDKILLSEPFSDVVGWLIDLELLPALLGGPGREAEQCWRAWRGAVRDGPDAGSPDVRNESPRLAALLPLRWALLAACGRVQPADGGALLEEAARCHLLTQATHGTASAILESTWASPAAGTETRLWLHRRGDRWREALELRRRMAPAPALRAGWVRLGKDVEELGTVGLAEILRPPRWLDGEEVARLLGVSPGPAVGEALARLVRAQLSGEVRTAAEARAFLLPRTRR